MVANQVEPWRGYEGSQFLEQLVGGQQQVGSAVGPGRLEREGELAVVADAQSSRRQGRARNIAAQFLETQPVLGGDAGGGVQGKAARGEAQRRRAHRRGRISQHPSKPLPGALPGGGEAAHGSGGDGGQNGLFVGQGIDLNIVEQAALRAQPDEAAGRCFDDLLDVVITQLRSGDELQPLVSVDVDAIQKKHVDMGVDVQRRPEPLHEGDRAAAPVAVPQRLAPVPTPDHAQEHL